MGVFAAPLGSLATGGSDAVAGAFDPSGVTEAVVDVSGDTADDGTSGPESPPDTATAAITAAAIVATAVITAAMIGTR
ncbi:hypothetical protein OHA98_04180 [Streptomyces sp. NBC_00654]|uniref:hypothetical protein n=1 Tax=Streptomyces sp. NBC_00654 TaxID=2975799 RepID=UPI002250B20A|nr:hypothetical protein [Streptomyces sp. NBC_00654]MCX4964029.1 hypothetical protein [Streptomyces sp. NBC_00654]